MTLTANAANKYELGDIQEHPAAAAAMIYKGAATSMTSGNGVVHHLVAGDWFSGFAERQCDNTGGAAGDKRCRVITKGQIQANVIGASNLSDWGSPVYMSDENTFTLTATDNTAIGTVTRWVSGTTCIVDFDVLRHFA